MNFERLWSLLISAIKGAKLSGSLSSGKDGRSSDAVFTDVSFAGSGRNAFVIKGWVDPQDGPAVRYRADWDNLKDGEFFYQEHPADKGWQETKELGITLERSDGKISIVGAFNTADDAHHEVRFTADIDLGDIFESFLNE